VIIAQRHLPTGLAPLHLLAVRTGQGGAVGLLAREDALAARGAKVVATRAARGHQLAARPPLALPAQPHVAVAPAVPARL